MPVFSVRDMIILRNLTCRAPFGGCEFCRLLLHLGFLTQLAQTSSCLLLLSGRSSLLIPPALFPEASPSAGWIINKTLGCLAGQRKLVQPGCSQLFPLLWSSRSPQAAPRPLTPAAPQTLCRHYAWGRDHLSKWMAATFPWPWEAFWCSGCW